MAKTQAETLMNLNEELKTKCYDAIRVRVLGAMLGLNTATGMPPVVSAYINAAYEIGVELCGTPSPVQLAEGISSVLDATGQMSEDPARQNGEQFCAHALVEQLFNDMADLLRTMADTLRPSDSDAAANIAMLANVMKRIALRIKSHK